jgi:hypothetical protein
MRILGWIQGVAELVKKTPNSSMHDIAPRVDEDSRLDTGSCRDDKEDSYNSSKHELAPGVCDEDSMLDKGSCRAG